MLSGDVGLEYLPLPVPCLSELSCFLPFTSPQHHTACQTFPGPFSLVLSSLWVFGLEWPGPSPDLGPQIFVV